MIDGIGYRGPLAGKSKGHIIRFNDGRDYVVKFLRLGFEKILPNEWIGYCLARFLGLPVPYSQIVELPEEFLTEISDTEDILYTPRQFATLHIPDSVNLHQMSAGESVVKSLANSETLAGIILLDYWLCNRDRNRNNVLLCTEETGAYRLWMIDHGDIFGSCNWTIEQMRIPSVELYPSATHGWMARLIETERSFEKYLHVVRSIPKLLIEEIVSIIPEDWGLSAEERRAIVNQLIFRRDRQLEALMHRFIHKVYRTQ